MTTARNDHTGDLIKSKPATDAYRNSPFWDSVEKNNGRTDSRDGPVTVLGSDDRPLTDADIQAADGAGPTVPEGVLGGGET